MNNKPLSFTAALLSSSLLLSACGGDPVANINTGNITTKYRGTDTQTDITTDNAAYFAELAAKVLAHLSTSGIDSNYSDFIKPVAQTDESSQFLIGTITSNDDSVDTENLDENTTLIECLISGTALSTITDLSTTIEYNACENEEGFFLTGRELTNYDDEEQPISFNHTIALYTDETKIGYQLSGNTYYTTEENPTLEATLLVTDELTGIQVLIDDLTLQINATSDATILSDISASVFASDLGYVELSADTLTRNGNTLVGNANLTGSDAATLQTTFAGSYYQLNFDIDNDGTFENLGNAFID